MLKIVKDCVNHFTTTLVGMKVTMREFTDPSRICTVQYPTEKREMPVRFRGMLVNDVTRCIACMGCARVCPVHCIDVQAEGKGKNRRPTRFTINYYRCCWCMLCVEACVPESLYMSHDYETVFTDRTKMIRDFVKDPIPPGPSPRERAASELEKKNEAKSEEQAA